jgi:hypothetical protein
VPNATRSRFVRVVTVAGAVAVALCCAAELGATTTPVIKFVSPSGGELFAIGSNQTVRLDPKTRSKKVKIEVSRDGVVDATNFLIDNTVADRKQHDVLTLPVSGPPSKNCVLIATDLANNAIVGTSPEFTIGGYFSDPTTTGSMSGAIAETNSTSSGAGATGGASGILGRVVPTSPGGYSAGVRGINNGTGGNGIGVVGYQAGSGWGVYGETPSGFGVYGVTTNATGTSTGVRGETFSANGIGVHAKYSSTGVGVALQVENGAIRVAGTNKCAFVHTATVANKMDANGTDIDNPMCNGDPNCILIVTQLLNQAGTPYNNSPIGVYYNGRQKWEIFNQNVTAIPTNAQFNVLVIKQ